MPPSIYAARCEEWEAYRTILAGKGCEGMKDLWWAQGETDTSKAGRPNAS